MAELSVPPVPSRLRDTLVLALVGVAAIADAQPRHAYRATSPPVVIVVPTPVVAPWYVPPPPPPYDFYVQQELAKRQPARPQSFEGSSPRCPKFFCASDAP